MRKDNLFEREEQKNLNTARLEIKLSPEAETKYCAYTAAYIKEEE